MPEFDTEYTDNLVCPYCGYQHEDPDDIGSEGTYPCSGCDKDFEYECVYTVTYISKRIADAES